MAEASTLSPTAALQASLKPILLLVGIAAAVAAGVTVVLWTRGPSYSLLYANIAAEDQSAIAQALDTAQIPYRIQPGSNNIEVASERVSEARMKLAGQGLPESSGGGFALMDKDPGFGVSQFMENARYQHALETELARTIANLRPVEGARVHLAIPHQTAFVRDHHPGSASVFVQVKPGRRLEEGQVQAIVNLVASSVPEMEASQVTVVDQQGHLLSAPEGLDDFSRRERQFDMVHRLEEDYTQRIEALLTPMIGAGRVRAQVVAQMDMSVSEEAHEQYKPDSQIVRSEQISEQSSRDGSSSGGVPGALTNQPPPAGVAQNPPNTAPANKTAADQNAANANAANKTPPATPATQPVGGTTGVAGTDSSSSKSTTRNYEIDRTLAYTHQPAGKLKRLTVAVLVDNFRTTDKEGKVKETPLTQQQIDHVTQLVKDAVGFDETRGDNVNVVNASFTSDAPPSDGELESPPIWESPMFLNMAKLLGGITVLLVLVLSVLRPMIRSLVGPQRQQVQLIPRNANAGPVSAADQAVAAAAGANTPALPGADAKAIALTHEQQVAHARTLANQDAKRVAQVVRGWVAQDE